MNAQTITKPKIMSFLLYNINAVMNVVIKIIVIVEKTAAELYGSTPIQTRNVVTFATVATVIHPKYTLKGTVKKNLSRDEMV